MNHLFVCVMCMNIFIETKLCMIMILIQICTLDIYLKKIDIYVIKIS